MEKLRFSIPVWYVCIEKWRFSIPVPAGLVKMSFLYIPNSCQVKVQKMKPRD